MTKFVGIGRCLSLREGSKNALLCSRHSSVGSVCMSAYIRGIFRSFSSPRIFAMRGKFSSIFYPSLYLYSIPSFLIPIPLGEPIQMRGK